MPPMSFGDQKLQAPCGFIEMIVSLITVAIIKLLLHVLCLYTYFYMYLTIVTAVQQTHGVLPILAWFKPRQSGF